MIVDSLSHVWESPEQLGRRAVPGRARGASPLRHAGMGAAEPLGDRVLHADPVEHFDSLGPVDVAMVFSFRSRLLEADIPTRLVADYVRSHPDRLVGVAGIDPTGPDALAELAEALDEQGMQAVAVSPSAQGFHPMDSRVLPFYREVHRRELPLVICHGPCPAPAARMEYATPVLLDEVLREFEGLKLVIAAIGCPWVEQTLALMNKHPNVLVNLGGLLRRPWLAYHALVLAQECDKIDRVLFASDFPYSTASACIETLYSINRISQGTNLPAVPRELLRGIVERDALSLLGIERASPAKPPADTAREPVRPDPAAAVGPPEPTGLPGAETVA